MMPPNAPRISGIYAIYSEVNGRRYIGSAVNFSKRWGTHLAGLRRNKHDNPHLQNAWNKYGEEAFEFVVLEGCEPELLIEREQYWFDQYDNKYNLTHVAGSRLGTTHTPETRAKISALKTGQVILPEQRAKISASLKGRKKSPEAIAKRTASRKGFKHTDETREMLRQVNLGKKQSSETVAKRVATQKANRERKQAEAKEGVPDG